MLGCLFSYVRNSDPYQSDSDILCRYGSGAYYMIESRADTGGTVDGNNIFGDTGKVQERGGF